MRREEREREKERMCVYGRVISNDTLQWNITKLGWQKQYAALNPRKFQIRAAAILRTGVASTTFKRLGLTSDNLAKARTTYLRKESERGISSKTPKARYEDGGNFPIVVGSSRRDARVSPKHFGQVL